MVDGAALEVVAKFYLLGDISACGGAEGSDCENKIKMEGV